MKKTMLMLLAGVMALAAVSCGNGGEQAATTQGNPTVALKAAAPNTSHAKKNVLVIEASPRHGGNTDLLSDALMAGAQEAGHSVEKIFLYDLQINKFTEAEAEGRAPEPADTADRANQVIDKMAKADVIVLASPVYFMNVTEALKTLIDRTFLRYGELVDKEFAFITACADPDESTALTAIDGMRGFAYCLKGSTEAGTVMAVSMGRKGAVQGTQYETQARDLGKAL